MRPLLSALPLLTIACITPAGQPASSPPVQTEAVVQAVQTRGVALFYGEREMLRRAIADHLRRKSSLQLRPLPDLALEVVRAQLAKDRAECGAPTVRRALIAERHPAAVYVSPSARCDEAGCRLTATVTRPPAGGAGKWTQLERWSAEVTDPKTANGWVNAVGSLAPSPAPSGGGGLLGSIGREHTPPVEVLGVDAVHSFTEAPGFAAAQPALDACHVAGWTSASEDRIALELAPNGRVARCEGDSSRPDEGPARMKCLCKALARVQLEAGPRGRRLALRVINHPGRGPAAPEGVHVHLEQVTIRPKFAIGPSLSDHKARIAACATRKSAGQMQVRLRIDGTGRAGSAEISNSTLPPEVEGCMRAALEAVRVPCPPSRGEATIELRVRVVAG